MMAKTKGELREMLRAARAALPAAEYRALGSAINSRLEQWEPLARARVVFAYEPNRREVPTAGIIGKLLQRGVTVFVPETNNSEARPDAYRRLGPKAGVASPNILDLVEVFLVPGLAFDESGNRVGQGGGYYDRLLGRAFPSALRVGLAYEFQVHPKLRPDPWDINMNFVVTETRIIDCAETQKNLHG